MKNALKAHSEQSISKRHVQGKKTLLQFLFIPLAVLFFSGCSSASVSVRTLYGITADRPSVQADTPDPLKPLLGRQQILSIDWYSPRISHPTLSLSLRFEDETIIHKTIPLDSSMGRINYEVDQALIREHGSLLAYQIILMNQDKELASSKHKLWVDPIDVK